MKLMKLALVLAVSVAAAGCGENEPSNPDTGNPTVDAGVCAATKVCGSNCCSSSERCDTSTNTCVACTCDGKDCGDDGCGNSCGTCSAPKTCDTSFKCSCPADKVCGSGCCKSNETCNTTTNTCRPTVCTVETDAQFCARQTGLGKVCGLITAQNNCENGTKTVDCGSAACTGATPLCDAATNTCTDVCVPETDAKFCERLAGNGKVCGLVTAKGNCEDSGIKTIDCGSAACTGATPLCDNAANACVAVCPAETNAQFCARMKAMVPSKECGSITAKDLCGVADKTVNCGRTECLDTEKCNAANNTCEACTVETKEEFCARAKTAGKVCGSVNDKNNCNDTPRSEDCGTAECTNGTICNTLNQCFDPCATNPCSGTTPVCSHTNGVISCGCSETSCGASLVCDPTSKTCVDPCAGVTCEATAPNCVVVAGQGVCQCTATSCGTGYTCDPVSKACVNPCDPNPCSDATMPTCSVVNGAAKCSCTVDSCGDTATCSPNGACVTGVCATHTCPPTTPVCVDDNGTAKCECDATSCGAGQQCNAAKACESVCTGVTCTTQGETCSEDDGQCHCNMQTPCAAGYMCDSTITKCVPICPAGKCTGETPICNPSSGACECDASSCDPGDICNDDKVCVPCVPKCTGKLCGDDSCGGSCGTCSTGTCNNATGVCETGTCAPSCTSGESCIASVCTCSPANGAIPDSCAVQTGGQFQCDATTLRCVSNMVTCNGTQCALGQVCADPTADDPFNPPSASTKICTCMPAYWQAVNGQPVPAVDTCMNAGMICDYSDFEMDEVATHNMSCVKPGDRDECQPGMSECQEGTTCETFSPAGEDPYFLCAKKCTTSMECTNYMSDSCQAVDGQNVCWLNVCARPWTVNWATKKGTENPAERAKFFQPCNSSGTGDGTCVPYSMDGYNATGVPQYLDIGYCIQNGTAPANGECDPHGGREDLTKQCGANATCDWVQPGTSSNTFRGVCHEMCNSAAATTADPAKPCATGSSCWDISGLAIVDLLCKLPASYGGGTQYCNWQTKARLGQCLADCNVLGANTCQPDALGNAQACFPMAALNDYTGSWKTSGVCYAVQPTTLALGDECATTQDAEQNQGDWRFVCAPGTWCNAGPAEYGYTNKCDSFCSKTTCSSNTASCAACQTSGAGYACVMYPWPTTPTPVQVGVCSPP